MVVRPYFAPTHPETPRHATKRLSKRAPRACVAQGEDGLAEGLVVVEELAAVDLSESSEKGAESSVVTSMRRVWA